MRLSGPPEDLKNEKLIRNSTLKLVTSKLAHELFPSDCFRLEKRHLLEFCPRKERCDEFIFHLQRELQSECNSKGEARPSCHLVT